MQGGLHVTLSASWAYSALPTRWEALGSCAARAAGCTGTRPASPRWTGETRRRIAAPDPAPRLDLVLAERRVPSVSLADNLRTLVIRCGNDPFQRAAAPRPLAPPSNGVAGGGVRVSLARSRGAGDHPLPGDGVVP